MKKLLLLTLIGVLALTSNAQADRNPFPKTITVQGSAEMELIPDEIYVIVDLKEYENRGSGKVGIEKIKQDFLNNLKSIGIADSIISIAAYDGTNGNPWWRKKNKKEELYASISYQVKLKNSKQVDMIVDRLDDKATHNFYIQRTSHSKLAEYRKQLKIQAVKAAKEKANYLAAAIDEKIGSAVTINEPAEYYIPYYQQRANVMMKESMVDQAGNDGQPVDFTKIKLKYDVTVVFALQ